MTSFLPSSHGPNASKGMDIPGRNILHDIYTLCVAQSAEHQICNQEVEGSTGHHCTVTMVSYSHFCDYVTQQYI